MSVAELAVRFHALFAGLDRAYGTYSVSGQADERGKMGGQAITKNAPVTDALWAGHLAGAQGIGIVPIRDDSTCLWGAIDVDDYQGLDHAVVASAVKRLRLPLIPCRSKSGGLHMYLFCQVPVPAARMRTKLAELAALLGFGTAEIFPKQPVLHPGDFGNWINSPYFSGDRGTRYAVNANGDAMTADEFLRLAEDSKVPIEFFTTAPSGNDDFADGPPCLQHLAANGGCPAGSRNNGLFDIGVYLRRAHPDDYKTRIEKYNQRYMNPPLLAAELIQVTKSVSRKTYNYRCNEEPIVSHCNAQACRLRKFGIGGESTPLPSFGLLKKLETDPPRYVFSVDGQQISLSTDELLSFTFFSRAFFERCNRLLPPLKPAQWRDILTKALETMVVEPMPEDASAEGQLWEHVRRFCTARAQALTLDEILLGKPYTADSKTCFRVSDLIAFLQRVHFKAPPVQEIAAILRKRDATHQKKKLKGQFVNYWVVPAFITSDDPFDVPDSIKGDKSHY